MNSHDKIIAQNLTTEDLHAYAETIGAMVRSGMDAVTIADLMGFGIKRFEALVRAIDNL